LNGGTEPSISPHPNSTVQANVLFFPLSGPILFLLPLAALIVALTSNNLLFLNYIHVMTGGMWTGIDLFMGIFGRTVMMRISPPFQG